MKNKLFIIAGEASGDMYGAYLIRLLKEHDPDISIQAWGGDLMKKAGADVVQHISDLSIMGFVEVIKNVWRLRQLFTLCQQHMLEYQADTIVFIDFPGFNLRLAPWAKSQHMRTIQYISPKVWAWKKNRIKTIKAYIDDLICIFPFEVDFYDRQGLQVHYFGNPLQKIIKGYYKKPLTIDGNKEIIALFPGSRKQEISRVLPLLIQFAKVNPTYQFVIGAMSLLGINYYHSIASKSQLPDNISIELDRNYDILSAARLAINTSGTITLETALFQKPQIVVYKTNPISYRIIKQLIDIRFISLPNILTNKDLIPELIQNNFNINSLQKEFDSLLSGERQATNLHNTLQVEDEKGLVDLLLSR